MGREVGGRGSVWVWVFGFGWVCLVGGRREAMKKKNNYSNVWTVGV